MSEKLLPCPFCGGQPRWSTLGPEAGVWCDCWTQSRHPSDWNTRHVPELSADDKADLLACVDATAELEMFDVGSSGVAADYKGHDVPALIKKLAGHGLAVVRVKP